MKKRVEIVEVEGEGLEGLLGEVVTLLCMNYFYTGKLTGVNDSCVQLEDPSIIYDTGTWANKNWADAQKLPTKYLYVSVLSIESFGALKGG